MHLKEPRFPCIPPLATTAAIVILLALGFSVLSAYASSPWVEVHPPVIEEMRLGIELIHFIDADNGWAEALGDDIHADLVTGRTKQNVLLRTSDGGVSWRQVEAPDDAHGFSGTFFYSETGLAGIGPQIFGTVSRIYWTILIIIERGWRVDMAFAARGGHGAQPDWRRSAGRPH